MMMSVTLDTIEELTSPFLSLRALIIDPETSFTALVACL